VLLTIPFTRRILDLHPIFPTFLILSLCIRLERERDRRGILEITYIAHDFRVPYARRVRSGLDAAENRRGFYGPMTCPMVSTYPRLSIACFTLAAKEKK
jgi:hypothetical protein